MKPRTTARPGTRYEHLEVKAEVEDNVRNKRHRRQVLCACDCGREKVIFVDNLNSGYTTSCGCVRRQRIALALYKHGSCEDTEYWTWCSMKNRCFNPNEWHYHRYGGRGITICERWMTFANFLEDMGRRPTPTHTLERRDNNGNYEPSNCRWATPMEQANNRSTSRWVTVDGQTLTVAQWARKLGKPQQWLRGQLKRGSWP